MALGSGLTAVSEQQATAQTPTQPNSQPQNPALPLTGKVAIVTGAARGIGRATVVELARQGANVVLLDIANPKGVENIYGYRLATREELNETVGLVTAEGRKAIPVVADVRNLAAMKQAVDTAVRQLGRVDILVANAGIAIWSPFAQMKPDQWQSVIDVNLTGGREFYVGSDSPDAKAEKRQNHHAHLDRWTYRCRGCCQLQCYEMGSHRSN